MNATRNVILSLLLLLALSAITPAALAARANSTTLLRYYSCDAATCATDATGSGLDLTATGTPAVSVPGFVGNAYNTSFTTTAGYWTAADTGLPKGTASGSVIAWVYYRNIAAANNAILSYGTATTNQWRALSTLANGTYQFQGNGAGDVVTGNLSLTGRWMQVAYAYDGSTMRIFMNGVQVKNASRTLSSGGTQFMIGQLTGFVNQGPNAIIDEVGLWNSSLTDDQIADNYNAFYVTGVPNGYGYIVNGTVNTTSVAPQMNATNGSITNTSFLVTAVSDQVINLSVCYGTTASLGTCTGNSTTAATLTASITGLTPNTQYYWNATGTNTSTGLSVRVGSYTVTTGITPDTTPPNFNATNTSWTNTSALITAVASENANLSVCYGTSTALGSCIYNATSAQSVTAEITGLSAYTVYYWNASMTDSSGNSNTTGPYSFTTLSNPDTTPPSFNVTNTSITNTSFIVTGIPNEPANMTVCYGTTAGLGACLNNVTSAQSVTIKVTGLTANTTYYYNVTMRDNVSNTNTTGPRTVTTLANGDSTPPTFTVGTSVTNTTITFTSTANEESNLSIAYGTTTALGTVAKNTTSAVSLRLYVAGLTPSTTYYYNATRCDSFGNCNTTGPYTVATSATPAPAGDVDSVIAMLIVALVLLVLLQVGSAMMPEGSEIKRYAFYGSVGIVALVVIVAVVTLL